MRTSERGFTLIETVVTVGIVALIVAAGVWFALWQRPSALRASVDQFDAAMAAVNQLAPASGNGATLIFMPRFDGSGKQIPGYVMRLYRGRPTADNAVTNAGLITYVSDANIFEATFGKPPFALFFSSAARPTGVGQYPSGTSDNPTFTTISSQPPCPANGITVTFTSIQGADDTRKLQCDKAVTGVAPGNPSPAPNKPGIAPHQATAYYVTNAPKLGFVASEVGYTHWFSGDVGTCAEVAPFAAGFPYSQPQNASETSSPQPIPVSSPYSWPNNGGGSMNNAPAQFYIQPVAAGNCTVNVVDQYGQTVAEQVQVMSDLTLISMSPAPPSDFPTKRQIDFVPSSGAVTIVVGKTYDAEAMGLTLAGSCGSFGKSQFLQISTVQERLGSATDPSAPTTETFTVQPNGEVGSCYLTLISKYSGDPNIRIDVNVSKPKSLATWPIAVKYGANGANVAGGSIKSQWDLGSAINALLGGTNAVAAGACRAKAFADIAMTVPDVGMHTFGTVTVLTDSNGCYDGSIVAYEPAGNASTFKVYQNTCGASLNALQWSSTSSVAASLGLIAGSSKSQCTISVQDSFGSALNTSGNGLVNVSIGDIKHATTQQSFNKTFMGGGCHPIKGQETSCGEGDTYCDGPCEVLGDSSATGASYLYNSTDEGSDWAFEAVWYTDSTQQNGGIWMVCSLGQLVPADDTTSTRLSSETVDYQGTATSIHEILSKTYSWEPTQPPALTGFTPNTDSSGNVNYCT